MGKVKRVNFIGGHHAQTYPTLQLPQKLPARTPCQLHQLHRHP